MINTKDTNPKDAIGSTKVALSFLSPIAKAAWSLAQFAGRIKYGAWNWRIAGVRASIYLDAAQRHLDAYLSGEELDPTDGTHHLGNLMACAAILLDAKAAGKLIDDRPPSLSLRPMYAEIEAQMAKLREQYKDKAPRHYTIEDTQAPFAAPPQPAPWKPNVGDRALIVDGPGTGEVGHIEKYDPEDDELTWRVKLSDGTSCWYRLDELAPAPPASGAV